MNGKQKALRLLLRLFSFSGLCLIFLVASSCAIFPGRGGIDAAGLPGIYPPSDGDPRWHALAQGIDLCSFSDTLAPVTLYGVRVDLLAPSVEPAFSSPDGDSGILRGETTLEFARRTGSTVAVNASPYDYAGGRFGRRQTLVGLGIYEGKTFSEPIAKYAALLLLKDGRALIIAHQTAEAIPEDTEYALGGFGMVLRDGAVLQNPNRTADSRTAAGTADGGRFLYLLVAEGEIPEHSRGLTFEETGAWLAWLGAENGMQLDGGGSATLVIREAADKWRIVNNPYASSPFPPPRIVANNLGFILKN